MARVADGVLYTHAGPEVGVASTKTHLSQIVALELLALYLAQLRGTLAPTEARQLFDDMAGLPDLDDHRSGPRGRRGRRGRALHRPRATSSSSVATSASPLPSRERSS